MRDELGGIRLTSTFEVIEEEPGVVVVVIEGPNIEFDEEEQP